ncbi:hypothetical protein OCU04_002124 [Sclerotinia nivalis]|uniref:Uncharacterized protein n=1 Tax=Sclerotinia nivalis TaxID=352851 RepID=A0A9X0AZH6_9HELO|nr:hypothetical protein OCU04_002124 [Sclerotinia nivalis]
MVLPSNLAKAMPNVLKKLYTQSYQTNTRTASMTRLNEEELNLMVVFIEKRTVTTGYNGNVISMFDNGWSPAPGDSKKKVFEDVAVEMSETRGKFCGMNGIERHFYTNPALRECQRKLRAKIKATLNKRKETNEHKVETEAEMNQANMNQANMNQEIEVPVAQDSGPVSWVDEFGNLIFWEE